MSGPGQINWGGDEIDLRAAEDTDSVGGVLVQSGLAANTVLLDALQFIAPETLEILAIRYEMALASVLAAQEPVPSLAARVPDIQNFLVTTEEDWGVDAGLSHELQPGDYFMGYAVADPSFAWEDPTNGIGGAGGGNPGAWYGIHDPGFDSETGPLFVREGDEVNVHLELGTAVGADDTLRTNHRLTVWWAPAEEEDVTEVRTEFPSRRGGTTI